MNNKDTMYFVSNEAADEDFRLSMIQSGREYKSSVSNNCDTHLSKLKGRGYITQALLDYVDTKGAISYTELESYYKHITGSNSFSHILNNLIIPYKNRNTQRYVSKKGRKGSDAKYVIKVANPSNWVEIDY